MLATDHPALVHVDNPMHEDRWSTANQIADRLHWHRRGMTQALEMLERQGLVESRRTGKAPSPWSDRPPRKWRLVDAMGDKQ